MRGVRRRSVWLAGMWVDGLAGGLCGGLASSVLAQDGTVRPALPFAMQWPSPLTQLDGTPWQAPNAAANPPRPSAVILVFWSITCPFCERHHPAVQALHQASAGLALSVVTTAQEAEVARGREALSAHLARRGLSFPVLREHERLRSLFGARRVTPTTVAIDRFGQVREIIPGLMAAEDVAALGRQYG